MMLFKEFMAARSNFTESLINEGIREEAIIDLVRGATAGSEFEDNVYAVGGYVRDTEMGRDSDDVDFVVDLGGDVEAGIKAAEHIAKKLGIYKDGSNPVVYPNFGTAKIELSGTHNGQDLNGVKIEFVAARSENYSGDSRKPDNVKGASLKDDAMRRDFTFNTLMRKLSDNELVDLTGRGLKDLRAGIIRTPLDPDTTFSEDPLRMLRAIRFAAKYGFDLPLEMIKSIKKNKDRIKIISNERIRDELNKMITTGKPDLAVRLLRITGLLKIILPEVQDLHKMKQGKQHKDDAFKHTLSVISNTPPDAIQRLAALFHDVGKSVTRSEKDGKVHFIDHASIGAELTKEIMRRLKYSKEQIDQVSAIVKLHMDLKHGGDDATKISDGTMRKLVHKAADSLEPLLSLIHADNVSHSDDFAMPNQIKKVRERISGWNLDDIIKAELPINGNDIVSLGAKGRLIGKIVDRLKQRWLEKGGLSKEQAIEIASNMIKSSR